MLAFDWRAWVLAFVFVCFGWYVRGQTPTFTLTRGTVTATETERSECYFQLGRGVTIVFLPGSTPCQIVEQELLGRSIVLQAVIEP